MKLFYIWLIAYATPALVAGAATKFLSSNTARLSKRNTVIMHIALGVSVLLSHCFIYAAGLIFPWYSNGFSILVYVISVAVAMSLLGWMGFYYGISALLQQLALLSMAFLLLPVYALYLVALLIVPLYAWCHVLQTDHRFTRSFLFLFWGVGSIFLFSISQDLYLIAALHALFGSLLISKSLLYPEI